MKLLSPIIFFILLVCSCTNENNENTDSVAIDSLPLQIAPEETKPSPKVASKYVALNASTYTGRIAEHQGQIFVGLVAPKHKNLKETMNGLITRSDTLYEVQYLPFKDQELYLHTMVLENIKEKEFTTNWCYSIIKNGSIIVEDKLISADFFLKLGLEKMNVGDTDLVFVGTKKDGTSETFRIPYNGKSN